MNKEDKVYVTRPSLPSLVEYTNEIRSIWDNKWITNMGPLYEKLRGQLAEVLGASNIELVTNGHMALELALQSFDFNGGGEVITTPFTFVSTSEAIVRAGLTPVFCDIDPDTYTIDTSKIEGLINEKTCAIVPVHVYGNICNVEEIDKIAKQHNLKVIYDAAHCVGEKYKGRGIGGYGDASCFSFHATKVFNSIEGGAICINNNENAFNKVRKLKNFGYSDTGDDINVIGVNAKMNEFSAAMGICNLRHLDDNIQKRKEIYNTYLCNLNNISGIKLNESQTMVTRNYAYFPIVIDCSKNGVSRDYVMHRLQNNNIFPRKYFYPLVTDFEIFKSNYDSSATPIALQTSQEILCLPIYPDLEISKVEEICEIIIESINSGGGKCAR